MKKIKLAVLAFLVFFVTNPIYAQEVPFHRGVNLTGWFQTSSARHIQFTKFTEKDFVNIKSLGCDVIRLPINLHYMTGGEPDYIIDPLFFYFLDQAVGWAGKHQIHLLIDNHTFDPAVNTDPAVGQILVKVWKQMAQHYKDSSRYIYYEILNEPHGIADNTWNQIQKAVIDTIRTVDTLHTLIVGPAGWNSYNNLAYMSHYADTNLIYTFHFYDPFLFTHQGASWTDPSMVPVSGIPFPYNAEEMPQVPAELVGTWIGSSYDSYSYDGTVARVKQLLNTAINFRNNRHVPVFCGEFGVYIPNSSNEDRVYWYGVVRKYLEENKIAWTIWDYTGGFGLFKKGSDELFEYDLNIPLVDTLGLNVPEQSEYIPHPDTTGFVIYQDCIMEKISESSWLSSGIIDFYDTTDVHNGKYSIYWSGADQYNQIGFDFKPDKDLSKLVADGFAVNFWIKGNTAGTRFDMRFLDSKTADPDDHPWRMARTITQSLAAWDGAWHHIYIPLTGFYEQGSWDNNTWYNPVGAFDWTAVDRFEIVAEHSDLAGIDFWFDNLDISDRDTYVGKARTFTGLSLTAVPNPFSDYTRIRYTIPSTGIVNISIYNITGQKVITLINQIHASGDYSVEWDGMARDGSMMSNGIYFCRLDASGCNMVNKLILLK